MLDIGCGKGGLLKYLRDKLICRVKGCDISDEAIKICKEKGIDAFKCDVEKEKIQGKYDVIVLVIFYPTIKYSPTFLFHHFIQPFFSIRAKVRLRVRVRRIAKMQCWWNLIRMGYEVHDIINCLVNLL